MRLLMLTARGALTAIRLGEFECVCKRFPPVLRKSRSPSPHWRAVAASIGSPVSEYCIAIARGIRPRQSYQPA